MKTDQRDRYETRDSVLKLLSDDEVAAVSTAETADQLSDGDEYLDLDHLEQGVRQAPIGAVAMGRILPRKAVSDVSWARIMARLNEPALRARTLPGYR